MARFKVEISGRAATKDQPLFPLRGASRVWAGAIVVVVIGVVLYFVPRVTEATMGSLNFSQSPAHAYIFQSGMTRSGVQCGQNVRQVTWSHYSPWCEPKFTGDNGGATSNGVSPTTITLTYRVASTADLSMAYSLIPESVIGTNQQGIATLQAMVNVFNKDYELYGRQVKLVPYSGESDFIQEDIGGSAAQAHSKADALNVAHSIHAFADISLVDSTAVYTNYLAQQKVVSFNLGFLPQSWFAARAPYVYASEPDCDKTAVGDAAVIGKAIASLPAIFAGDPAIRAESAKIGVLVPASPLAEECAKHMDSILASTYHVTPAITVDLPGPLTLLQDSANLIAQLIDSHVTTVICAACDPLSPILILKGADAEHYYPEWYAEAVGASTGGIDGFGRIMDQKEMDHAMVIGQVAESRSDPNNEAWQVWERGKENLPPSEVALLQQFGQSVPVQGGTASLPDSAVEPLYELVYAPLAMFFAGLQNAGPDLTPKTFAEGIATLPDSVPGGELGDWSFGANNYDPQASFQIDYWDPAATSANDGQPGTFVACNGGDQYSFKDQARTLPAHEQLHCFGH